MLAALLGDRALQTLTGQSGQAPRRPVIVDQAPQPALLSDAVLFGDPLVSAGAVLRWCERVDRHAR